MVAACGFTAERRNIYPWGNIIIKFIYFINDIIGQGDLLINKNILLFYYYYLKQ